MLDDEPLTTALALARGLVTDGLIAAERLRSIIETVALPAAQYRSLLDALERERICVAAPVVEDDPEEDDDDLGPAVDGFGAFIRRSRHEILTFEQEQALGARIDRGRLATRALSERSDLDEQTRRWLDRQVADGRAAAEDLALHNIRLVMSVAKRYAASASAGLDFEDLVEEGYLGLAHAITKWEYQRGLKFSTYATWWIQQSITRAIADKSTTIRLPVYKREQLLKVLKAERGLLDQGQPVTVRRLATATELPPRVVREVLSLRNRIDSLDRQVGHERSSLGDLLADQRTSEPEVLAELAMLELELERALSGLSDREREVVRRRFGLDTGVPETLEEIGGDFGVTRERIRQIESKVLTKLRHPERSRRLEGFIHDV